LKLERFNYKLNKLEAFDETIYCCLDNDYKFETYVTIKPEKVFYNNGYPFTKIL